jgi:DNA-directed RNA polymerase specialized sigma24 family protein
MNIPPLVDPERDIALIEAIQSGDDQAANGLLGLHLRHMRGFLALRTPTDVVLEKLARQSLARAYRRFKLVKEPRDFEAWLYAIALHEAAREAHEKREMPDWSTIYGRFCASRLLTQVIPAEAAASYRELISSCWRLPDDSQDLLTMRYSYGASLRDVAEHLQRDEIDLRVTYFNIRRLLYAGDAPLTVDLEEYDLQYIDAEADHEAQTDVETRLATPSPLANEIFQQLSIERFLRVVCDVEQDADRSLRVLVDQDIAAAQQVDSSPIDDIHDVRKALRPPAVSARVVIVGAAGTGLLNRRRSRQPVMMKVLIGLTLAVVALGGYFLWSDMVANGKFSSSTAATALTPPQPKDGFVVEAEGYVENTPVGDLSWSNVFPEGAFGSGAMQVAQDSAKVVTSPNAAAKESPKLTYKLFLEPGSYYVWLRVPSAAGEKKAFVALAGQTTLSASWAEVESSTRGWQWVRGQYNGAPFETRGDSQDHTFEILMRDPGFVFDTILFTRDPNYIPK